MTDKIFDFVINLVREEERRKTEDKDSKRAINPALFYVERQAGSLVLPCEEKAKHHREREKVYTEKLEEAEKELREKGVTVEAFDPSTGSYLNFSNALASGNVTGVQQNFQPRVDQRMADEVRNAKTKMLEHRGKAWQYEKYAAAFSLDGEKLIRLTVEDVFYFGLKTETPL